MYVLLLGVVLAYKFHDLGLEGGVLLILVTVEDRDVLEFRVVLLAAPVW
jgi:hypothetical protein